MILFLDELGKAINECVLIFMEQSEVAFDLWSQICGEFKFVGFRLASCLTWTEDVYF
jgi:hypothetical protein